MSFIAELKRRNVIRMAGLYLVGAWLIVQVSSTVLPMFDAPTWLPRSIVIVLAVGFIPALIFSWVFELTPSGIKRDEDVRPDESIAPQTAQRMNRAIIVVLVLALGYFSFDKFVLAPRREATQIAVATKSAVQQATQATNNKSIAVLPFENLSADKDNAYFATGMQDEILTRLAGIHDLKVISRTSTEQYASHPPNLKIVAEQLGVATVLEGSVQKAEGKVRINLQLIDARSDSHLWAQNYDRDLKDVFAVQSDVAEKVADALKAQLLPAESARIASVPTQNQEAYDLYLRALAFSNRATDQYGLTSTVMPQAIDLLQQALSKDPNFAQAAALLGRADMFLYFLGPDRTDARLTAAKNAAEQALALQPDLGEAHFALALYWYWGFRDYAHAQQELELARKTLPHDFYVVEIGAAIARRQGKWEQALEGQRQAQTFDPRNASPAYELAQTYAVLRRYAEADRACAHSAELSAAPVLAEIARAENTAVWKGDLAPLRAALAALSPQSDEYRSSGVDFYELAWLSRDYTAAVKVAEEAGLSIWTTPRGNGALPARLRQAWAYAAMGNAAKAKTLYAEIHQEYQAAVQERPGDWDRHMALGFAAAGLGIKDEAIREGRRATELLPISRDAFAGPEIAVYLAQLYARVGEDDQAIGLLQQLLAIPAGLFISPALLRLDPVWDPLRKDPRFQKLLEEHPHDDQAAAHE